MSEMNDRPQKTQQQQPPVTATEPPKQGGGFMGGIASAITESAPLELEPYLPADLVGGSIPHIAGKEEEAVWNAAAQACGTERVHYCYTISDGRCWYLATPSSSLASSPDSWCPLAAALPGNSEHWDKQTVYLYEQEGAAGALRWDQETGRMQIFLGASRTILPRIQSMEANFVTINPEGAEPIAWKNRALHQEKMSRILVRTLMFSGLGVTFFALLFWAGSYLMASILKPQLDEARQITNEATNKLLEEAANSMRSNVGDHMVRLQELLDTLSSFGGSLLRYEVKENGSVEWEALIPSAVEGNAPALEAKAVGMEGGRVRIMGTR